eukprot:scaffold342312_cov49-Prasinocladus_malaysianus.AAC.2
MRLCLMDLADLLDLSGKMFAAPKHICTMEAKLERISLPATAFSSIHEITCRLTPNNAVKRAALSHLKGTRRVWRCGYESPRVRRATSCER